MFTDNRVLIKPHGKILYYDFFMCCFMIQYEKIGDTKR